MYEVIHGDGEAQVLDASKNGCFVAGIARSNGTDAIAHEHMRD
jgi:hypothetical protein